MRFSITAIFGMAGLRTCLTAHEAISVAAVPPDWGRPGLYVRANGGGSRCLEPTSSPPGENGFLQIQFTFSLFFGLAVKMYEGTLVANDTPFGRFVEGQS